MLCFDQIIFELIFNACDFAMFSYTCKQVSYLNDNFTKLLIVVVLNVQNCIMRSLNW